MKITIQSIDTMYNQMGYPNTPTENVPDVLDFFNDRVGWELSDLRNDIETAEIFMDDEIVLIHELVNR